MKQQNRAPLQNRVLSIKQQLPPTSRLVKVLSLFLILGAVFATTTTPASAHTGVQSYIYLDVDESSMTGRIEAPIPDLRDVLGLNLKGSDEEITNEVNDALPAVTAYLAEHFVLEVDGETLPIRFDEASLFFSEAEEEDDNYMVFPFEVEVADVVPREFDLRADFFIEEVDNRENWLIISNDYEAGVIENGYEEISRFTEPDATESVKLGEPDRFKNLVSSVKLGVDHMRTGPDHILFVLVLLLPSVLVFKGSWKPSASFGSALWRVLKIVTMFTLAHSVTFTLTGIGVLPSLSSRVVESIIALSIAAAALHNLRPIFANREWLISFVFGLFHGMGFASLISGLDVKLSTELISLFGRNLGIEIGQAIVILLLFPALFLLRRTTLYSKFFVVGSLLLTFISLGWMIERLFDTDLGLSKVIDPVFEWPRVLTLVVALTIIAAITWWKGNHDDQLLPVADQVSDKPLVANS